MQQICTLEFFRPGLGPHRLCSAAEYFGVWRNTPVQGSRQGWFTSGDIFIASCRLEHYGYI